MLFFSCSVMSNSLWPYVLQHTRLPYPSPSPGACSNSCPLPWWCHPTISSSVISVSSCLQYFPASGSFPMSRLLALGGQSIRASASVLPVNIQDWFPLGLTGWISSQSKGLSRVFSSTTHSVFAHLKNCGCLLHTSHYAHRGEEATLSRHWLGLMLLKRDSCQLKGFQLGGPTALRNWRPLLIFHFWM